MNSQEQNWTNLFGKITSEGIAWHGIWTRYSPEKEVLESFQGVRNFRANENKTVITHTNNYIYADGSTAEKSWQIEKETCNQPDGIMHPALLSMRALSFGQGVNAVVSKILENEEYFGVELFLQHENFRTSLTPIYGKTGDLERMTLIREQLGSFPDEKPELEVDNISGNWIGKREYMTPDLKVSPASETQQLVLDANAGKNKTFFLPDGVVVNAPKKVEFGEEFEIAAGKFVSKNEYKRLTAKYDESGKFSLLISEVFERKE
ncbi:DUF3598 family protein [Aerosakkonema funiforme]|uniref:DUF3598 family protein n=3 Tax=Oscillatoriophycideae TaxID=1301283 RepID=A0A926VKA9_9CYAN|nr:DUF3598 family protein [Aerosakkonema funiforme]MBD2185462.1 DUF3598 family protein [Aerosakkonema funiforme FACHB-1375]